MAEFADLITETANKTNTLGPRDHSPDFEFIVSAAEIVWGLIYGQLRGRIPDPLPPDLSAVAVSATHRYVDILWTYDRVSIENGTVEGLSEGVFRRFNGFSMPEILVLHRYRQRTA